MARFPVQPRFVTSSPTQRTLPVQLWHRGAGSGLPLSPSGGPNPAQEAIRPSQHGRWSTRVCGNRLGQHGRRGRHADRLTEQSCSSDASRNARTPRLGRNACTRRRLAAYSGYAGTVSELKRGLITVWFRRLAPREEDAYRSARVESDRLGAAADTADFRLQLVADDPVLRPLMDAVRAFSRRGCPADRLRLVLWRWGPVGKASRSKKERSRDKAGAAARLVPLDDQATCDRSSADEKQLNKTIACYGRVDLLCIDELGYMELDRHGAELLFQVLTEREEKNSVAIASNESFGGWTKTFTDPRLCAAIVDRLTFNGTIIETGTDSYRLASTRAKAEQVTA